jgi:hypothetical protein
MSSAAGAVRVKGRLKDVERQIVALIWSSLLLLFVSLALFLLLRRFSGALARPLPGAGLIAASATIATIVAGLRQQVLSTQYLVLSMDYLVARPRHKQLSLGGLGGVAVLLLYVLTLPGTPSWAIAIAWLVLISAEIAYWRSPLQDYLRLRRAPSPTQPTTTQSETEDELPAGLVQRLTRVREDDRESIHALLPTEIPSGDRLSVVHLAFCPPLDAVPELTAHSLGNEEAEVRITQAESFGVRIEVRLPQPADVVRTVLVEILGSAICRPAP